MFITRPEKNDYSMELRTEATLTAASEATWTIAAKSKRSSGEETKADVATSKIKVKSKAKKSRCWWLWRRHKRGIIDSASLLLLISFVLLMSSLIQLTLGAGGDCLGSGKIDCFECNSWDDPRCHDPFNYTLHKRDMPKIRECEGCCVKMVQFIGTEHYQVKRTCTDNFEVNFFMVNHACMTEGHRHGHMCFCEEDECNDAPAGPGGGGQTSALNLAKGLLAGLACQLIGAALTGLRTVPTSSS